MTIPLGTNFAGLGVDPPWEQPTLNIAKYGQGWQTSVMTDNGDGSVTTTTMDTNEESILYTNYVDADGYPTTLAGSSPTHTYNAVYAALNFDIDAPYYCAGTYDVYYDGAGTICYRGPRTDATLVSRSPGHDVISVVPSYGGMMIAIVATDPLSTGNYLKNIRIVPRAYADAYASGQHLNPELVSKMGAFNGVRCMDWGNTLVSEVVNWSDRNTLTSVFWCDSVRRGYLPGLPIEFMCEMANATPGPLYLNMPVKASNDYMLQAATLVKSLLHSDKTVYVEHGNEYWNNNFSSNLKSYLQATGASYITTYSIKDSTGTAFDAASSTDNLLAYETVQTYNMAAQWRSVWTGADASRLKIVIGGQCGYSNRNRQFILGQTSTLWTGTIASHVDVLATAPYFAYAIPPAWTVTDPDLDKFFTEVASGGLLPTGSGANTAGGTSTALTLTSDATWHSGATPANGTMIQFVVDATRAGGTNPTLAVDGGTARPIQFPVGTSVSAGVLGPLQSGITYTACHTTQIASQSVTPAWVILADTYASAGSLAYTGGMLKQQYDNYTSDLADATAYSVGLVGYESGQTFADSSYLYSRYAGLSNTKDASLFNYYGRAMGDGRMGSVYKKFYNQLLSINNSQIFNFSDIYSIVHAYGYFWGLLENIYQSGSPRYDAMMSLVAPNKGGKSLNGF